MMNKEWRDPILIPGKRQDRMFKRICTLAFVSQGRHVEVLAWFRGLLHERGPGSVLEIDDLDDAQEYFASDQIPKQAPDHESAPPSTAASASRGVKKSVSGTHNSMNDSHGPRSGGKAAQEGLMDRKGSARTPNDEERTATGDVDMDDAEPMITPTEEAQARADASTTADVEMKE
jgi:hypothetical protein